MRLQKQLANVIDGKEYPKYVVIIPPSAIEELRWRAGEELEHEVKEQSLIIRKVHSAADEEETLKLAAKYAKRKRR